MTITLGDNHLERRQMAEENLRTQIERRLLTRTDAHQEHDAPHASPEQTGIDMRPANAYEAVTRQMVESLSADLQEIKSRLNNLLFMIAGAILLDVIGRMIGT